MVSTQHRQRLVALVSVTLITLAGMAVRTIGLDRDLWADEQATLQIITSPLWELASRPLDETPFLYYALQKLFLASATSPAHVRMLAYMSGILAIPLIYIPARFLGGRNGAIMAVGLLAFWPSHVQYSQEARAHSMLFLFVLLSLTGFLWWLDRVSRGGSRRERRFALVLFGVFAVLSFYTHLLALFWLAIVIPVFVHRVATSPEPLFRYEGLTCLAVMTASAVPGMRWLWLRLAEGHGYYWLEQATPLQAASMSVAFLAPSFQAAIREAVTGDLRIPILVVLLLLLLSGFSLILALRAAPRAMAELIRQPHNATVLIGLAFVPVLFWLIGFKFPILSLRNLVWAGSGPILLWTLLLAELRPRALQVTGVGAVWLALVTSSFMLVPTYSSDVSQVMKRSEYLR